MAHLVLKACTDSHGRARKKGYAFLPDSPGSCEIRELEYLASHQVRDTIWGPSKVPTGLSSGQHMQATSGFFKEEPAF